MTDKIKQVDALFTEWAKATSPGCAIGIMQGGEILYQQGYGMANLEYDIPITPETSFHIASVSKQFTAMAIALLAHEGKLSLDDDIRVHIPEMQDFGETITLRHMLHHTSGLRDDLMLLLFAGWRLGDVITTDDILDMMSRQTDLNFPPNTSRIYCNAGYTLMSYVIERVSGQSLRDFCEARIFQPLGMVNTQIRDNTAQLIKQQAYSYYETDNGFGNAIFSDVSTGATNVQTSVGDLLKWANSFHGDAYWEQTIIDMMHTKGVLKDGKEIDYALGIYIREHRGLTMVEHSGADAGYGSMLIRFPEQDFSVVVLNNLQSIDTEDLAIDIAEIYLTDVMQPITETETEDDTPEPEAIELSTDQLEAVAGVYYHEDMVEIWRFEVHDNQLVLFFTGASKFIPTSETKFYYEDDPSEHCRFVKDEATGQFNLYYVERGEEFLYTQRPKVTPTVDELEKYAGRYYSPELDVFYHFVMKEGQLHLRQTKRGTTPVIPTFADAFVGNFYPGLTTGTGLTMLFERDDSGQITGFTVSFGRVKRLMFVKQD